MDGQMRLWRGAPEAIAVNAHFEPRCGWQVRVRTRRSLETWPEARDERYDHLSTEELYDALVAELAAALGL